MNYRAIIYYTGMVLKLQAIFLLFPLFAATYYNETEAISGLLITAAISLVIGLVSDLVKRLDRHVYVKDSFVLVAICWIVLSVFGALPYVISGVIPSFSDALFESVSGFTTTGASILTDVEAMPKGLLLWRSLTQWMGGMGVLVLLLAVTSMIGGGEHSVYVMKAESPGPTPGKLVPRLRQSSKILYGIYIGITLLMLPFLVLGKMPVFDSICTALSTVSTGGFGITNTSIGGYNSLYLEVVLIVFMLLGGINFNIHFYLLTRNLKGIARNEEFWAYLGIFALTALSIAGNLTATGYSGFGGALRAASFSVASVYTTTGFATADFSLWPQFSRFLILMVMLIGGSAGSTSGGIKVSRILILFKEVRRLLTRMAHPRAVGIVKMDGKAVDKQIVHSISHYFITFSLIMFGSIMLVSLDNFDFETTITSVITCIGNVGPGFGMISPVGNFSGFSAFSKVILSMNMLIGRLEIYPVLLLFLPRTWRNI